ncbi:MAG: helix-turn-helix transcriptional regulator [Alphaproteobacteria bacterium]|nr:helix-turn-helix transcriptional regulator [Alphaproteobacteria bacterium]
MPDTSEQPHASAVEPAEPVSVTAESAEPEAEPKPSPRANAADHHVGARIRERRIMLGLSQQQLAQMIGVTYQQAHKYERGLNRISAGRLYEIAQVLGVPVSWFFDGLSRADQPAEMTQRQRMCLELARNFAAIENEKYQEALSQMARALANPGNSGGGESSGRA